MAVILADAFTGADGAAWDTIKWINAGNPTSGGGTTILGNAGRMTNGTTGGYSSADRVARRWNIPNRADVEMTGTITFDGSDAQPVVGLRSDSAVENGYVLRFNTANSGTQRLIRVVGFAETTIGRIQLTPARGSTWMFRFRAVGGSVQAKLWAANVAEPGAWSVEYTDPSPLPAGTAGIALVGAGTASSYCTWDDLAVADPTTLQLTGSANLGGSASLGLAARVMQSRTATMSGGAGTLTAVGRQATYGAAVLSGGGGLTGIRTTLLNTSGSGQLAALGHIGLRPYVWAVRNGVLVPAIVRTVDEVAGNPVTTDSAVLLATLRGTGALAASGQGTGATPIALTGSGQLDAAASPGPSIGGLLFGAGGLTATTRQYASAAAALAGSGALSAVGRTFGSSVSLGGSGTLTASGTAAAPVISDQFTGTDGAAWSASIWVSAENPTAGGSATIQGNKGRMIAGSTGGYTGNDRIARRFSIADRADSEFTGQLTLDVSDPRPVVVLRGDSQLENGYQLSFFPNDGGMALTAAVSYSYTDLAVVGGVVAVGGTYSFRYRAVGSRIQANVWAAGSTEPAGWQIDVTDTRITAAGKSGVGLVGGGSPSLYCTWDNLAISDTGTAAIGSAALTGSGTLTASGSAGAGSANLFVETFTGTNGAAWSSGNWIAAQNPTAGGGTTIQGNAGQMVTGSTGGYVGADRIARRMNITDRADSEVSGTFIIASGDPRPLVVLRGDAQLENGYMVELWGTLDVVRGVSFSYTTLATASGGTTATAGTKYGFRARLVGTRIQARTWVASGSEPTTWHIDYTDPSPINAAGKTGLAVTGGSGASLVTTWDDILVTDPAAAKSGTAPTAGSGTLTATGNPQESDTASLAGSGTLTTPTASLTVPGAAGLTGAGALAAAGNLGRIGAATLAGSGTLTASGVASTGVTMQGSPTLYENAAATTAPLAVPSGVQTGELLWVHLAVSGTTLTAPSGWILVAGTDMTASTSTWRSAAYYRVATAGDVGATHTWTGITSGRVTGIMQRIAGVNGTPIDVAASVTNMASGAGGSSLVVGPITTVTDKAMLLSGSVLDSATANSLTDPPSMTRISAATGTGRRAYLDYEATTTHGSTGTRTWTASTAGLAMGAYLVALRPA